MTRALLRACALFAVACQTKQDPPRAQVSPPQRDASAGSAAPAQRSQPALPDPLPGARTDLSSLAGSALRGAIGDLDGDGDREIVLVDASRVRVVEPSGTEVASLPVTRGIQALVVADLDGDRRAEVLAGWGVTREHMDTKAAFTRYRLQGGALVEETVLAPETSRQDVAAIVPMAGASVVLAYFESKYIVASVVATRAARGWETTKVAAIRTATSYARGDVDGDGTPDLVVGRVYGDEQGADGDAFVLRPDGTRTRIPSTRGMRSIAIADGDGDGRADVFLGDGWHQNYGTTARGQLSVARFAGGAFTTELVDDVAGQYAIEEIVPAQIDGALALVTRGSHYVRVYRRVGTAWRGITIAGAARDVAVGDLDGQPGDEILILGDRPELVSLRGVAW